jgi:small subunit ribosomal protein S33
MGNKILRARLKGPALAQYYPKKMGTFQELQKALPKAYDIINEPEEERLEALTMYDCSLHHVPQLANT